MENTELESRILALLAAHPEGLAAAALRHRLQPAISQPTLSRRLMDLRARGLVAQVGAARATRYVFAGGRHRLVELRSRALHQRVAEKVIRNPEVLNRARQTLDALKKRNPAGAVYHDQWEQLLEGDRILLLRTLTDDSEQANALRQESPFAGVLSSGERQQILERFRAA